MAQRLVSLSIIPGETVGYQGGNYLVKKILSVERVLLESAIGQTLITADIKDLTEPLDLESKPAVNQIREIVDVSDKDWKEAQRRFKIIQPVLQYPNDSEIIKETCKANKVSVPTLYRWLSRYRQTNTISSLVPEQRTGGKGKSRLEENVEAIIKGCIESIYLTKQRKSIRKVCLEVIQQCNNAGIQPPHSNTVRNRIISLSEEMTVQYRLGKSVARQKFEPQRGSFPGADYPLSVVQIDHTKLDIILVDDVHRNPIGRPWITLAIDIFSRTVLGFYISFDPPGALGVGMCLSHAILPKEIWLERNGIKTSWSCYGVMKTIHADNAKEFRGNMLQMACQEYGIDIDWRPVKTPHWGGHIERLLGTLLKEIHTLPGTTFSNTEARKHYNSEKKAALTLKELETWLTIYITDVYHKRVHATIGISPLQKWTEGILGKGEQKGIGLPRRILHERKLWLDFMPYVERSIQEYGVLIDYIHYYHDVLRRWVNSYESTGRKHKIRRKFIFKRDPRDISVIYFFDPDTKQYHDIPYRNTSFPPISIWEHREVVRKLGERQEPHYSEEEIFAAYAEMKAIEEKAVTKTAVTKRNRSKAKKEISQSKSIKNILPESDTPLVTSYSDITGVSLTEEDIEPFEDLEYGTLA